MSVSGDLRRTSFGEVPINALDGITTQPKSVVLVCAMSPGRFLGAGPKRCPQHFEICPRNPFSSSAMVLEVGAFPSFACFVKIPDFQNEQQARRRLPCGYGVRKGKEE